MLVKFGADVEVDIATKGELAGEFNKAFNKYEARPNFIPVTGTSADQSGGNKTIRIGRPPTGKVWNILTVTTFGADDFTAVTGQAALYVDVDAANLGLGMLRVPKISIPDFRSFTKGTLWAHSTGDVCANLTGITGSAVVGVTVTVAEWNECELTALTTR